MRFHIRTTIGCFLISVLGSCAVSQNQVSSGPGAPTNFELALQQLARPDSKYVLVAAHRGDWRNAPENSIQALKNCIKAGVDIMEVDLKMTKDSVLIIMHDKTIDRSTTGRGLPQEYTLSEIKNFKLRNGLGTPTDHNVPTFSEFLEAAKGKIIVGIDKGYAYLPQVIALLQKFNMTAQAIVDIDDNTSLDEVEHKYGKVAEDILLMPIVVYNNTGLGRNVAASYLRHKKTIIQPVWKEDAFVENEKFTDLVQSGYGIWLNSMWSSLCGGHYDDKAVEQQKPDESWGWLIKKGATIIQTDRPKELLNYLRQKRLHW